MNILAVDLGTKLGYARRSRGVTTSGVVSFAPRAKDGPGQRWLKFRAWLGTAALDADLGAIYYEQPILFVGNGPATVLMFGGFEAHLQLWAEVNNIPLHKVNVSTIKRHWTGKGNAKKADMVRVARERGLKPVDDNEADALALLDYAMCDQGEPTPTAIEVVHVSVGHPDGGSWVDPFKASVDPMLEPVL